MLTTSSGTGKDSVGVNSDILDINSLIGCSAKSDRKSAISANSSGLKDSIVKLEAASPAPVRAAARAPHVCAVTQSKSAISETTTLSEPLKPSMPDIRMSEAVANSMRS